MSSPPTLSTPARLRWWLSLLVGMGLLLGQDESGRLTFESVAVAGNASQNKLTTYTYNAANNRTEKTLISGSGASSQTETWSYSYNSLNQLEAMTKTSAAGVEVGGIVFNLPEFATTLWRLWGARWSYLMGFEASFQARGSWRTKNPT